MKEISTPKIKIPKLPQLLDRKIYKTGQTRGADDDVIYQNRVSRNSTVLIPYSLFESFSDPPYEDLMFENGFIVLISPSRYFSINNISQELESKGLFLGINTLIFYETRADWNTYNPDSQGWNPAQCRKEILGGEYVARVPATTSTDGGEKIIRGFDSTSSKGAGIRLYEYANSKVIKDCRLQLEALYWSCFDSHYISIANGMSADAIKLRSEHIQTECQKLNLLDTHQLMQSRIINSDGFTVCPLCLEEISSQGFFNRLEQAAGREVLDLTITQINLFHIEELKYGAYNHKSYNLGWGHHHCNVVVKDSGIMETLRWMNKIIQTNIHSGHFTPENNPS